MKFVNGVNKWTNKQKHKIAIKSVTRPTMAVDLATHLLSPSLRASQYCSKLTISTCYVAFSISFFQSSSESDTKLTYGVPLGTYLHINAYKAKQKGETYVYRHPDSSWRLHP